MTLTRQLMIVTLISAIVPICAQDAIAKHRRGPLARLLNVGPPPSGRTAYHGPPCIVVKYRKLNGPIARSLARARGFHEIGVCKWECTFVTEGGRLVTRTQVRCCAKDENGNIVAGIPFF